MGIYLGRADDHSPDSVCLFNISTQKIVISRDIKFMNQFYNDFYTQKLKQNPFYPLDNADDDDDDAPYGSLPSFQQVQVEEDIHATFNSLDNAVPDLIDEQDLIE
jgi:hypothetical protein